MPHYTPPVHPCNWSMYHVVSLERNGDVIMERVSEPKIIENKKTFFLAREEYARQYGVEVDRIRGQMIEGTEKDPNPIGNRDPWAWTNKG